MGNISLKADAPDTQTGLTPRQVKLVQSTWQTFCTSEREYGALLFSYMFAQQPELQELFPKFRDKPLRALKDDLLFRAHGCAVGYHLTSMVASLEDAAALKVLAWRNALKHLKRNGVLPDHFEVMGNCIVDAMRAKDVRPMTAEVVKAWWKFTEVSVLIVRARFLCLSFYVPYGIQEGIRIAWDTLLDVEVLSFIECPSVHSQR
ncbi:hypothetical protein HPB48_006291 [Haemaphysalis longicornis]|uniref:Globin domain-containing protein n=1 Tax=Haemaphysalis longicornis TaxID=44386 RepID=A0A9J6GRX3_HAELO|nr:hypothetical protein HPB48_006291 [Haemaphysalis longicornis]